MKKCVSVFLLLLMFSTIAFSSISDVSAKKVTVYISATGKTLLKGQSTKIKATSSQKSKFKWTSSRKSVAVVSKTKTKSGQYNTIKSRNCGTSIVRATAQDGTKLSISCKVRVYNRPKINKTKLYMYNSNTYKLNISGGYGNIRWSTSNRNVATVNSKGVVTANKYGTCIITAKRSNITMKCRVQVYAFYYDYGFKDVYNFGAVTGTKLTDVDIGTYQGDNYCNFYYNAQGKNVTSLINLYESKLESKDFVFGSQEEYSYGTTDYYYRFYEDDVAADNSIMVAITDFGNSTVEISIWR